MAKMSKDQVVLSKLQAEVAGYTHETISFTVTATSANGSLLVAAGTEATKADAANVVAILDCPELDQGAYEVGDVIVTRKVVRGAVVNKAKLTFSDGALAAESLSGLAESIVVQ